MPNYIVPLSEACYDEFQNIKKQLQIIPNFWSDSEILKMIFEKINVNEEFMKELQSIGKTTRGRSIHLRNVSNVDNVEYLSKCPECQFQICMLKHSLNEVIKIEMNSHFDNFHNKSGYYQCLCNLTFDWLPAYLRHQNICDINSNRKASSSNEELLNQKNIIPVLEHEIKSKIHNVSELSELKSPVSGICLEQNSSQRKSLVINKNPSVDNFKSSLIGSSENSIKSQVDFMEISNSQFHSDRHILDNVMVYGNQAPLVKLTCQCRNVFDNYNDYQFHTLKCESKILKEKGKLTINSSETVSSNKSVSKNLWKDLKPDHKRLKATFSNQLFWKIKIYNNTRCSNRHRLQYYRICEDKDPKKDEI